VQAVYAVLVFAVTFLLHYNYLINTYYHFGAAYNDAGILSQIVWRSDWKLTPPLFFVNYSFYGVHVTPIFNVLNALSYFVNTHMAEFYSTFIAATYASLALTLFYIISRCVILRNHWQIAGVALLCALFGFNPIIMNGIWIGHFEYAIPLGILLFVISYTQGFRWGTLVAFVFTLSIREDAGLHLVAVLGLVGLLKVYQQRSFSAAKHEIVYSLIALIYSGLAMWLSLASRNYFGSTFQDIYSGKPPFAHISWTMLWERLSLISTEHIYLWSGFLLTVVVTIKSRNPYMLIGYAAYIPWFIMNWIAVNPNTGHLYAYYAFPFITSLAWPLLGVALQHGFPLPKYAVKQAFRLQIALVLVGLIMWNDVEKKPEFGPIFGARWGSYTIQHGAENRVQVRDFIGKLQSGAGNLGAVIADNGILSLAKGGQYQGKNMFRVEADKPANTIIYMEPYGVPAPEVLAHAAKNKLATRYCMPATTVCIITDRSPAQLGLFLASFIEKPMPKPEKSP
jgi:hypothetical protein